MNARVNNILLTSNLERLAVEILAEMHLSGVFDASDSDVYSEALRIITNKLDAKLPDTDDMQNYINELNKERGI